VLAILVALSVGAMMLMSRPMMGGMMGGTGTGWSPWDLGVVLASTIVAVAALAFLFLMLPRPNPPAIFAMPPPPVGAVPVPSALVSSAPESPEESARLERLQEACIETLKVNRQPEGYIRPLAFYGYGNLGVGAVNPVQVTIATWPWGAYLSEEGLKKGIRAKVSSFTRMHVNVNMVRAKISGQYVNSFLANREAVMSGYDEAILLDTEGYVAEGSGENLYIVKNGTLFTPSLSSPVLAGITRDSVLKIAKDQGVPIVEQKFTRDTMYLADELFMTGTAAELTPVREVDNRRVGSGQPGPVTKKLQETFFRTVHGEEQRYREWLTYY